MLSTDANLLLYAYHEASPHFRASRRWLEDTLNTRENFGIPVHSILAFIRIGTSPGLPTPFSVAEALEIVDSWLAQPRVSILPPGPEHWSIFRRLCLETPITGRLTADAHLAALAIEHNATFFSADRDFGRFRDLIWRNPLTLVK